MKNTIIVVLLGAVLLVLGYMAFFKAAPAFGATPAGNTGSTARQYNSYGNNLAAPGVNATSTSILNNTGQDLYITAIKAGCENIGTSQTQITGAGLAALTLKIATSSTATTVVNANPNLVGTAALTIATATPQFAVGSSTTSASATVGSSLISNIWPAGSYLNFWTNATNTAVCTFGVDAFNA